MTVAPASAPQPRSGFLRAVLVLISGTAAAHGITALTMPVLTRLYSPAEFGLLAVFSGLLSILAVAACLRYELAITLPEGDDDAWQLLGVSLFCCATLSSLLALIVALAPDWLLSALGQPQLAPYLWLAPLGLLLAGTYSALQFWFVRQREFTGLARTRVAQSAASNAVQAGLGWLGVKPLGLLLGYVLNTGVACVALGASLRRQPRQWVLPRMRQLALEQRRFPLFSTWEALANSAAIQWPVIMIAGLVAPAEAGYLMMAMYVAQAPMSLIGTAISQVYLSRAPDEHRQGRLGEFSVLVLGQLMRAGVGPLLAAGILSPVLFGLVFGAGWERAGWLVAWMTPWFVLQFLAVPLSMALHVTGGQRAALALQVFGLALRVGGVAAAGTLWPAAVAEAYAITGALFYAAYLGLILRRTQAPWAGLWSAATASLSVSAAWATLAGLGAIGATWLIGGAV